jgi:hypothetical protein
MVPAGTVTKGKQDDMPFHSEHGTSIAFLLDKLGSLHKLLDRVGLGTD